MPHCFALALRWAILHGTCLWVAFAATPYLAAQSQVDTPDLTSFKKKLDQRLSQLWDTETIPKRAFAGVVVLDAETGQLMFERNGSMLFTPASNAKLFSTALALSRLGPSHRMSTTIFANGSWSVDTGVLSGDLVLRGGGDPSVGSRQFPYSRETKNLRDYPLPAFESLADQVFAQGVRRIRGNVVGDDSAYQWEPFREGWAQDDALFDYGAPVSALTVNDNSLELTIMPGKNPGMPAAIAIRPSMPYYDILNEVRTVARNAGRVEWERTPNGELILRGNLAAGGRPTRIDVAIDDPALYAARYLRDALVRRGIAVDGAAMAQHRWEKESEPGIASSSPQDPDARTETAALARHDSPPLDVILRTVNKESMNLFAELLLCEVGRAKTGAGSREAGLLELRRLLKEFRVPSDGVALFDASGLARLNLVSPAATAQLLSAMWQGPYRTQWIDSLPVGGEDGTLEHRFSGSPRAASIHAKTGTLRGVGALSGYATSVSGRVLVFSAMVNNHAGSSRTARDFLDKIALELVESN